MTTKTGWSWWAVDLSEPEEKPEVYQLNESTREAVIEAARREYGPRRWIAVVEATHDGDFQSRPFDEDDYCRHIERLLETFMEENAERWGESDGPEFGFHTGDLAKALNDAFEKYIRDNYDAVLEGAWAFTAQRNAERVWLGGKADA